MIPAGLEVRGSAVDLPKAVKPLLLSDYPHKTYYWINPPLADEKKWPFLTVKMKRREEKLQELLSTPVDIKRRKITGVDKLPFEMSPRPLPTYRIMTELYKSQCKPLEDLKTTVLAPYTYDKSPDTFFDLSVLYPYMSNAYKKLYGQHIDNLKELTRNFNLANSEKPLVRRTIKIGFTDTQDSSEN